MLKLEITKIKPVDKIAENHEFKTGDYKNIKL